MNAGTRYVAWLMFAGNRTVDRKVIDQRPAVAWYVFIGELFYDVGRQRFVVHDKFLAV